MAEVTLISSEGQPFHVETVIATMSQTVRNFMEAFQTEEANGISEPISFPLSNVLSATLKDVIEWCTEHKDDAPKDEYDESLDDIPDWDRNFFKNVALFDIIVAANYMDIRGLLILSCKAVANMVKGKSSEEIRRIFDIVNDLTDEEESILEKETAWIELMNPSESLNCTVINKPFPLMDLPNEIITIILLHMRTSDRLRARVNKKLFAIEAGEKYYLDELAIVHGVKDVSDPRNPLLHMNIGLDRYIDCEYYIDILQKMTRNFAISSVYFSCKDEDCPLVYHLKAFSTPMLTIEMTPCTDHSELQPIHGFSLPQWISNKDCLNLPNISARIGDALLYILFNDMANSLIPLRRIQLCIDKCSILLSELEITFESDDLGTGTFYSRREDLQIFSEHLYSNPTDDGSNPGTYFILIGGNMLITVCQNVLHNRYGNLSIERHEDDGSLPPLICFLDERPIEDIVSTCDPVHVAWR